MSDELLLRILTDPTIIPDPYPLLRELRETAPVHRMATGDYWVLTRYADCRSVLRDVRLGSPEPGDAAPMLTPRAIRDPDAERSLLFLNPPDHTRLRSLVSRAFTPRRIEGLRRSVVELTDELLDDLAATGGGDIVERLAFPLPANVISALVGVPRADRDWLRPLVADLTATLEPTTSEADMARADVSGATVRQYMLDLIHRRRADPRDDLLSGLIAASDGEDRLTEAEVVSTTLLIYAAGFETTTNLIGNMVYTLLRHPDQLARVRTDRMLVAGAVEEVLRFETPVQVDGRYAFEDIDLAGHTIGKGNMVMTLLAAANRDPAVVDRPDSFDVARPEVPLLSFSSGIHYCLGASLARLEAQVVLERLLARFERWGLVGDDPPWKPRITLRGLEHLEVTLTPARVGASSV